MLKTFSLKHDVEHQTLLPLLTAYLNVLNVLLQDIWEAITWRERKLPNKNQKRLLPKIRGDNAFKRYLRNKNLQHWEYAKHWVDSALKTAYSIIKSWEKNYRKGKRKRNCPQVRRTFACVK